MFSSTIMAEIPGDGTPVKSDGGDHRTVLKSKFVAWYHKGYLNRKSPLSELFSHHLGCQARKNLLTERTFSTFFNYNN